MPRNTSFTSVVSGDKSPMLLDQDTCLAGIRMADMDKSATTRTVVHPTEQRAVQDAVEFLERLDQPQRVQMAIRTIAAAYTEIVNDADIAVFLLSRWLCCPADGGVVPMAPDQEVRVFWKEVAGIAEPSEMYLRYFGGVLLQYGVEQLRKLAAGAEEYDRRMNAMLWPDNEED